MAKAKVMDMKAMVGLTQKTYDNAPDIDEALVMEFIELENKQLQMMQEVKKMWERQKEIKNELLTQLPGDVQDKVKVNINGILINKTVQDKRSIDTEKAIKFARGRRMLSKVAQKAWVLNKKSFEAEVNELLKEGKVTKDDLSELMDDKLVPMITLDDTRPAIMEDGKINLNAAQ